MLLLLVVVVVVVLLLLVVVVVLLLLRLLPMLSPRLWLMLAMAQQQQRVHACVHARLSAPSGGQGAISATRRRGSSNHALYGVCALPKRNMWPSHAAADGCCWATARCRCCWGVAAACQPLLTRTHGAHALLGHRHRHRAATAATSRHAGASPYQPNQP